MTGKLVDQVDRASHDRSDQRLQGCAQAKHQSISAQLTRQSTSSDSISFVLLPTVHLCSTRSRKSIITDGKCSLINFQVSRCTIEHLEVVSTGTEMRCTSNVRANSLLLARRR